MDEVIKLVRTYRHMADLDQRLLLGEKLFRLIEPDLHFFVFSAVGEQAAEDVSQETLKAVATGLPAFKGSSTGEFWAWCYRIASNKLNDHFRTQANDRLQPMPPEELWQLVDESTQASPLSPEDKLDLEHAMTLLTASKPECYQFLWKHFVFGLDYSEIAEETNLNYDNVRMKIGRCLDAAQSLMS